MYDGEGPGGDDDILTIEVFGGSGGDGGGGLNDAVKNAAFDAAWSLKNGGTAFVVVGGILMVVGGYTAWTGGGAGIFVGGTAILVIGAGALAVGNMLDEVWRDPPQADYKRPARVEPTGISLGALDPDPPSPANRAVLHLNMLAGLAPATLDALERLQGAEQAGDAAWTSAWRQALGSLDVLTRNHLHGLGAACADLADGPGAIGHIPHADLVKGLEALQGKKSLARLVETLENHGVPSGMIDLTIKQIGGMRSGDLPGGADLAGTLRGVARQLQAA